MTHAVQQVFFFHTFVMTSMKTPVKRMTHAVHQEFFSYFFMTFYEDAREKDDPCCPTSGFFHTFLMTFYEDEILPLPSFLNMLIFFGSCQVSISVRKYDYPPSPTLG
jgi:hypothetical protein